MIILGKEIEPILVRDKFDVLTVDGQLKRIGMSIFSSDKKKIEFMDNGDNIKNNFCKENNILLIRIPYWEKHNIEKIILDFIKEHK